MLETGTAIPAGWEEVKGKLERGGLRGVGVDMCKSSCCSEHCYLSSPVGSPAFLPNASMGFIFHEDLLSGTFQVGCALGRILCPSPKDYIKGKEIRRNRMAEPD